MADDRGELQAMKRMIEICRARAADLGIPGVASLLDRAEQSLSLHAAWVGAPRIPRGPALSVPRQVPERE